MSTEVHSAAAPQRETQAEQPAKRIPWDWCTKHLVLGLAMGASLGIVGQIIVSAFARGDYGPTNVHRFFAVVYSTLSWGVAGTLLSLVTRRLLYHRIGRIVAIGLSTALFGSLSCALILGVTLRVLSGSYLTAGAVMFSMNSSDHMMRGFTGGYAPWFLTVFALVIAVSTLVVVLLRRSATRPKAKNRSLAVAAAMLVVVVTVYAKRSDGAFLRTMFVQAPLLALVSSLQDDYELTRLSHRPGALGEALAPPGPSLKDGDAWLGAIHRDGPRPNVIMVMLESVSPYHMSKNGYARPTTPELDRLARDGLDMQRAWTTATHSNYAQPAVISSLFPRRVQGLDEYQTIDYPRFLFHDAFHALGYDNATISSQDEDWQGIRRFQTTGTPTFYWHADDFEGPHLDSGVEEYVADEFTTDKVLEWMSSRNADQPFALYLNYQATHFPYTIPSDAPHPYEPYQPTESTFTYLRYPESERQIVVNRYDNALSYVDLQIGRLRRFLQERDEFDNTLWIVTSDHGEQFFHKEGLVTHGRTLYEVETRVPLFLHWPQGIAPDQRDDPVSNLDAMPTLFDVLEQPPHPSWQGSSFAGGDPKEAIFINIQGLRFADGIVCWPYKLIIDRTVRLRHLYNLAEDPDESDNLFESHSEIAARLTDTLRMQLIAQLDYHADDAPEERRARYAPRLRPCPALP